MNSVIGRGDFRKHQMSYFGKDSTMFTAAEALRLVNSNGNEVNSGEAVNKEGNVGFGTCAEGTENGNKFTAEDSVELEGVSRGFNAAALTSGTLEPTRTQPALGPHPTCYHQNVRN